jgi:hypothetical protein
VLIIVKPGFESILKRQKYCIDEPEISKTFGIPKQSTDPTNIEDSVLFLIS